MNKKQIEQAEQMRIKYEMRQGNFIPVERHDLILRSKISNWVKILTALNEGLQSNTIEGMILLMTKEIN